jgi:CMP-N-acetylneuraminic acid synthetase
MLTMGLICARAGSKGVPGKNLAEVGGRSLLARAIDAAHGAGITRVIVSTDGEDIAAAARAAGAEVPFMRPAELSGDRAPEWHVWRHALDWMARDLSTLPDALVVVPTVSPLRAPEDVARCVDLFDRESPDVVITVTEARRNPWFNMVTIGDDGQARLVNQPEGGIARRQDAPAVYDMATVAYVARPRFVLEADSLFAGTVRAVVVPPERAIDIDEPIDLVIARALAAHAESR